MNKKISILLFFLFVLISMSAVSAVDADGNNDTIVSSADAGTLALANDVDAIDDLDENYSDGDTKALSSDAKSVAVGKNNEIYGATYEEAEGDSMSPMLGDGYYNININFDPVYSPEFTFFMCDVMGPDMPSGTLDLSIDNSYTGSFRVDNGMCRSEIHSLDAGDHTWYAEFIPDGGGEKSTEERSFTIDQGFAYVYIDDPEQSSIEMGVGESRNFRGHVDGPESSEVNISSSNDNVAKFRASSSYSYGFEGYIDAVGAGTATITVSFAGNKNYKAAQSKTLTVTVIVPSKTIYVNATANQGGDGNQTTPFQTLQDALDIAEDGDTIMIASGTYTGENNTDLTINNNLTFEKYGEGEAIFDAQELSRIWTVTAATINITGLTFKNGKITANSEGGGAAIYIENVLSNSIINASFINNVVVGSNVFGGAILFEKAVDNVEIYGEFINNTVDLTSYSYGGAISFKDAVSNSIINATFADNSANKFGGAIYFDANKNVNNIKIYGEFNNNKANSEGRGGAISFREDVSNSIINALFINNAVVGSNIFGGAIYFQAPINNLDITGKFINNTGKDVIYIGSAGSGNEIHDAVFLNNAANNIINIGSGSVYASDNWFGNNATNYNETPANVGIDLDNWLFLNATADSRELEINESSTINFKLYKYSTSGGVTGYNGPIDIQMDLTQTLGELNQTTASLGEEITYTAKNIGIGGATATFETASYTAEFDIRTPTEINVTNSTLDLKVNEEVATGATLTPADAGNLTYTSSNSSVAIVENGKIKALKEGNAIITVSFAGNEQYRAAENKTIAVTVTLRDAKWTYIGFSGIEEDLDGASLYLPLNYAPDCFVRDADGIGLPAGTDITVFCEGNNNYTITTTTQDGGLFNVDVSDVEPYQVYMVSFSAEGYTAAIASVYVIKAPTEIYVANATVDMKVKEEIATGVTLNPSDAGNLTYTSSDSGVAIVEDGKIVAVGEGSAIITVSFAGNDIYAAAQNRTIDVTVSLRDAKWTYIGFSGIEEDLDGASLYLPLNYAPDCFVRDADGIGLPAGTNITVFCEGNENYTIASVTQENGLFKVDVSNVKPGMYKVSFSTEGYTVATANVLVIKVITVISADDVTGAYRNTTGELVATITDYNGEPLSVDLNVEFNGESYTLKADSKGQISIPTGLLNPGTYTASISYVGDDIYAASSATADVVVTKADTVISASDISVVYKDSTGKLVATLTNVYGKALPVYVNVNLNGTSYDVLANSKGQITIPTKDLDSGNYTVTITYNGNGNYNPTSKTVQITVNKADTIITAADVYVNYADPSGKLVATLTDEFGNAISDNVTVNINGAVSTVKSNSKGQIAVSTAKLTPKTYTVTITYNGDGNYNPSSATATISVNKTETVMTAPDTSVAFKNTTKQTIATLTDAYGKGLAVYVDVTLDGETSAVRANYWGEISVSTANLAPGTYDVSISYKGNGNYYGSNATSQITVTKAGTVMTVQDTSVAYKNTTNKTIATITDAYGKGRAVYVNVTLNGETFAVRANYWGEIGVSTANLAPGTYDVTVSYKGNGNYNGSSATAQITVDKAETTITAPDISVAYKDVNGELVATLTNAYGKPLSVYVTVNLNGKDYDVRADSNGQIIIPTNTLSPGTYTATITYKGNGNYNPTSTTAQITVNKADTVITAQSVTVDCGDPDGKLVATLTNAYGKALSVYVTVDIDGVSYDVCADSNGQISIPTVELASGTHTATITYNGNGNYNPTSTTANIVVKP